MSIRLIITASACAMLTGCVSSSHSALTDKDWTTKLRHQPVLVMSNPEAESPDEFYASNNLKDWMRKKVISEYYRPKNQPHQSSFSPKCRAEKSSDVEQQIEDPHHCFTEISSEMQRFYRDQLILESIALGRSQCDTRIDYVGGYLATGDATQSTLEKVVDMAGIVSTDAITSRIASGIGFGLTEGWNQLSDNVISGPSFSDLTTSIRNQQNLMEEKMKDNMKAYGIEKYPFMAAVYDINRYDDVCDLFN